MIEPYETLLGQYKDHPVVGIHLQDKEPDWSSIWTNSMPSLSSGEKIMFEVALALYNGNGVARIADIFMVDYENQLKIIAAMGYRIANR